jgi:hypothetical protein
MGRMRYAGVDLLTRRIVEDLPLYGVAMGRRLSGFGNMTGTYKLGTKKFSDEDLLTASEPGRMAVVALRDEVPIWGGPIWVRTYQSQSKSMQLQCQTYESIFASVKVYSTFTRRQVDQLTIFKDAIATMQAQGNNNFGLDTSGIGTSGVLRDVAVEWYEHQMWQRVIDDLLKQDNTFDYSIDLFMDEDEVLQPVVRAAYPYLGFGQDGVSFDYPGQITNFWYPESAARGGTRLTMIGKGEGSSMKSGVGLHNDLLAAGYPGFDIIITDKEIENDEALARAILSAARQFKTPVTTPTIELKLTDDIEFAEWNNLGAPIHANIEDVRFPDGLTLDRRMIGWDLRPESSESVGELKLVLEGNDG